MKKVEQVQQLSPTYDEREGWKDQYRDALTGKASLDELVAASEGRFRAWFFRSAEGHPSGHPSFPVFVSMLLNETHIREAFPSALVPRLIAKYGQCPGPIDGSYWVCKT